MSQVRISPHVNETAVVKAPYSSRPPITLRGSRLRMRAPTTPNIENAATNGNCSPSASSLMTTKLMPTIAMTMKSAKATHGHRHRSGTRCCGRAHPLTPYACSAPTGTRPDTTVPRPGAESTVTSPSRAPSRSAMPCSPVPYPFAAGSKPCAVVGDREPQLAVRPLEGDRGRRRVRVLRHVLEGLERGEVDGRLDLLRQALDAIGVHVDGHRRLASLRDERRCQALVGEQRRIDTAGEVAQIVERTACVHLQLGEHRLGSRGVAIDELLGETLAHLQRDELLLGAVVDVALELPAFVVLGGDEALLRGLQVGQPRLQIGR